MADATWNCATVERAKERDGKNAVFIEDKEGDRHIVIDVDEIDGLIIQLTNLKLDYGVN